MIWLMLAQEESPCQSIGWKLAPWRMTCNAHGIASSQQNWRSMRKNGTLFHCVYQSSYVKCFFFLYSFSFTLSRCCNFATVSTFVNSENFSVIWNIKHQKNNRGIKIDTHWNSCKELEHISIMWNERVAYQLKPLCIKFSSFKLGDNMLHKYMHCSQLVPNFANTNE